MSSCGERKIVAFERGFRKLAPSYHRAQVSRVAGRISELINGAAGGLLLEENRLRPEREREKVIQVIHARKSGF